MKAVSKYNTMRGVLAVLALLFAGGLASSQTPVNSTVVKAGAERIEYSRMIFGQFIEHFDNQIYGGIYCPGNPLSDEDGFRTDVIQAMKELRVPLVRWPGGCFASTYHWRDGVGVSPPLTTGATVWDRTASPFSTRLGA